MGVLTVAVLAAVPRWTGDAEQFADTTSLELVLRGAHHRAVAEGHPLCVDAATRTAAPGECGPARGGVTFFPDGSATPGVFRVGSELARVDESGQVG